jgi:hypothetical protein
MGDLRANSGVSFHYISTEGIKKVFIWEVFHKDYKPAGTNNTKIFNSILHSKYLSLYDIHKIFPLLHLIK